MKMTITYKPGVELSYAEYGQKHGFPLLVQHGLIASIEDVDLFEPLLRQNVRLICIARPGYGESSPYILYSYAEWADVVAPLVRELKLVHFDVLGISSGAPYAYSLGYHFPDKVRNIFIFSGMPALYDEQVLSHWPHEVLRDRDIDDMKELAQRLFFANLSPADLQRNDIRDSMSNHGFGVAQDLILRYENWEFPLSGVKAKIFMHHSKTDESVPYQTAVRTAALLPDCTLELSESGPHFSREGLAEFLEKTVAPRMKD